MRAPTLLFLALLTTAAHAATFIVPSDRVLVSASKAIVVAVAGESHGRWAPGGWIETITELRVEEAIKGPVAAGETIRVTELGGVVGEIGYAVAGAPRYAAGERVLLFLETNDRGEWVAKNMAVGKFDRAEDLRGRRLLVRDAEEIAGWESDGAVHREPVRLEDEFLGFVRAIAQGRATNDDAIRSRCGGELRPRLWRRPLRQADICCRHRWDQGRWAFAGRPFPSPSSVMVPNPGRRPAD